VELDEETALDLTNEEAKFYIREISHVLYFLSNISYNSMEVLYCD